MSQGDPCAHGNSRGSCLFCKSIGSFLFTYNPAHKLGTCGNCGHEMTHNVPRMGDAGGWVHLHGGLECPAPAEGETPETDALAYKIKAQMNESRREVSVHDLVDMTMLARNLERRLRSQPAPVAQATGAALLLRAAEALEWSARCMGERRALEGAGFTPPKLETELRECAAAIRGRLPAEQKTNTAKENKCV